MDTTQDLKLAVPADNWGVEMQARRLDHPIRFVLAVLIGLATIVWVVYIFATQPDLSGPNEADSRSGWGFLALVVTCIIGLGVGPSSFSKPYEEYSDALDDAMREYGRTHFRTWLNNRYDLAVTEQEAVRLFRGYDVWMYHEKDGRTERVSTHMENIKWLRQDTENFERANRENDMPYLMYVEAPAQPRTYQW